MAISSTTSRNDYTGNGATSVYPYTFKILADTDLLVTQRDTDGVETTLTLTTDYTVSGVGNGSGGNVTLVAGNLTTDYALTIRRVRPMKQLTDIRNQGDFYPETHEDAFDHLVMLAQQVQDSVSRSLKTKETDYVATLELPLTDDRASKFLAFDASGDPIAADTVTTAPVSTFMETVLDDTTAAAARATLLVPQFITDVSYKVFADSPITINSAGRSTFYSCDCTSGAIAITLPTISGLTLTTPFVLFIKKTDSTSSAVTITRGGTDTIEGATSKTLSIQNAGCFLIADTDKSPDQWAVIDICPAVTPMCMEWHYEGEYSTTATIAQLGEIKRINKAITVTDVKLLCRTAGSGGTTTIDLMYKRGGGSWTTIFSTKPALASGAGNYAVSSNQVLSVTALQAGDLLGVSLDGSQTGTPEGFDVFLEYI